MSDPTMNREIEDVLSSIRRLVSQDRSQPAAAGSDAPASRPAEPAPGALVLTPALRVVEGDAGAPAGDEATGEVADEAIGFDAGRIRGDMVLAALGAVGPIGLSRRADDALDQTGAWTHGGEAGPDAPDDPGADAPHQAAPAASLPGAAAWRADADADESYRTMTDDLASLETTIAELEAAVAGIDEDFEADGGEADGIAAASSPPLWPAPEEPAVAEADASAAEPGGDGEQDPAAVAAHEAEAAPAWPQATAPDQEDTGSGSAMAASGATLTFAARRLHLAAEDSGSDDDAADLPGIADPHPAEDVPETSRSRIFVRRAPVADPEPTVVVQPPAAPPAPAAEEPAAGPVAAAADAAPAAAVAGTAPASGLPEVEIERLRLLVAEVLRQELRGALGERITQNVRKLVRREIHRALDSRDFE